MTRLDSDHMWTPSPLGGDVIYERPQDEVCHVIRGKMEQFEHNSSSYPRQHHYLQPTGSSAQDISGQLDLESGPKKVDAHLQRGLMYRMKCRHRQQQK